MEHIQFISVYDKRGESNGKLPLRTCPGCSIPEPYRSPDWALVLPKLAQGLNTNNNNNNMIKEISSIM
jgi:hypothetical protein